MATAFIRHQHSLRCYLLALTAALVFTVSAHAQSKTEDELAITSAMQAMDEFLLAFNQRDAEGWAASLNYPHVRFASGTVTVWHSAEDFSNTDAFEMLSKSGWDHSHWLTRDVVLVSPEKVHIATVFQRFNDRNEIIGTYQSLYIVTQQDGHWGTQARSSLAP